ncbi:MAG: 1-acyl-sn-glycerol-3-phosphate acyltransferase [Ardenticatenaceae bacterium]|nr:1-acyl-sn-glycerol-3-phosphate acyltransferase [Anaerolineales bacterium]MCB8921298.1 1-acyl-sn-glycerol-3-phosphate acyltransferase [Ardenticatenaceae bacterium]MCB8990664.1 1-acyl-sn-glycerol-3-phosphate acyltransferase [Ardenticatenaceae bacterium]
MRMLIRLVARILIFLIADVETIHVDYLPKSGKCIVASNHLGRIDAILTLTVTNRDDLILMIAEKYHKSAMWRFVAKNIDAIWLNRFETDFHAMREVTRRLQNGQFLAIAPEGTRSQTEALIPAKSGAAFLAAKTNAPIIPVALYGTEDRAVKTNLRRLKRSKVVMRAGKPFTLPPLDRKNRDAYLEAQTDEIMCRIAAMLPEQYRGVYADHPRLHELLAEGYEQD